MTPDNADIFRSGLVELGLSLDDERIARLIGYHDFVLARNAEMNLVGFKDERDSVIKNLLNALGPWRQVFPTKHTCDVGSGAGFPGLPLAIALDMADVTLVESKAKKAKFLAEACTQFAPRVKVLNVNFGEIKERYRQIIFCAFGSLNKIVRLAEPRLYDDGRILAYKGKRETIDQEIMECKARHKVWQIVPFKVPGLEAGTARHLCIYKSVAL